MVLSPGSLHHRSGSCASASPASSGWNLACPAGSSALPGPRCKPYTLGHGTLPRCNSLPAYLLIGCKNIRGPLARIPPQLSTVFPKAEDNLTLWISSVPSLRRKGESPDVKWVRKPFYTYRWATAKHAFAASFPAPLLSRTLRQLLAAGWTNRYNLDIATHSLDFSR